MRLVPPLIESAYELGLTRLHDVQVANGNAFSVGGVGKEVVAHLVGKRHIVSHAPLLHNHVTLRLHALVFYDDVGGPVAQQQQTGVHQQTVVSRNVVQQILHGVEAREAVHVGSHLDAVAQHEGLHATVREVLGALEHHVLREVGDAAFVVALHHGAALLQQTEEHAVLR